MNNHSILQEMKMDDVANDCPKKNCSVCNEDYYDYSGHWINEHNVCSDCFEQMSEDFKNEKIDDYDFFDEFGIFPSEEVFQ